MKSLLDRMFEAALKAVSAECVIDRTGLSAPCGRTFIASIGKAAAPMAVAAARRLQPSCTGLIVTRDGHGLSAGALPSGIEQIEAGHPVPDARGVAAADRLLAEASALGPDDLLLALVSGGASALVAAPVAGVTLAEKAGLTRALLASGAPIAEMNLVRRHLSQVKGGRLAAATRARVVTLVISDVPGDDPSAVGSGPTVPDGSTRAEARAVLARWGIDPPPAIARALAGDAPPVGAPNAEPPIVIARAADALAAAAEVARAAGYEPVLLGDDLEGDAEALGREHAALALDHAARDGRWALLSGGETTVVVRNRAGRGGRCSTYLAALTIALDGAAGVSAIAADTDGIDGSEDNAGAVMDPTSLARAAALGLAPAALLADNRSYDLFAALGDPVVTGPTRTNVNDFRCVLVDAAA